MKSFVKKTIEKFPLVAHLYRTGREEISFFKKKPKQHPGGFLFIGDPSMEDGSFEVEETKIIIDNLKQTDVFVDIGANYGYFSCLARSKGKQVVAIEPHPKNLRVLFKNFELNNWSDIEVWPIGLSDRSQSMTLWGNATGASLIRGWSGVSDAFRQVIAVSTLDNILRERFTSDQLFIKIDVEGAEYNLLKGAMSVIQRELKPVWLVEITLTMHHPGVNENFYDTFKLFMDNGYAVKTADHLEEIIEESDLQRWVQNKACDKGTHNWIFFPKP